jgi:hypothetical protein
MHVMKRHALIAALFYTSFALGILLSHASMSFVLLVLVCCYLVFHLEKGRHNHSLRATEMNLHAELMLLISCTCIKANASNIGINQNEMVSCNVPILLRS